MPIRVLVADDHKLFRTGFVSILSNLPDVEVLGEADSGESLLRLLTTERPDIVLLDLKMPGKDGMAVLETMAKKYPLVKAIVVSMYDADSYILSAIESGAKGYLNKNAEPEEVLMAIRGVYAHDFYFNEQTNNALLNRMLRNKKITPIFNDGEVRFSDLELSILKHICDGLTSEEIAKKVYRSKRRIEAIRQEMMKKVGVANGASLIVYAMRHSLVEV